jgi:uncharacterized phage-associated protein
MTDQPYSSLAVANYFIQKGVETGKPVTPMKVQKLVFIAHGYYLAIHGEPLVRENFGAWPWGPVIGTLYAAFVKFSKTKLFVPLTLKEQDAPVSIDDEKAYPLLERVWQVYQDKSASYLSNLTHAENAPWTLTYEAGQSRTISNDLIKNYYKGLLSGE